MALSLRPLTLCLLAAGSAAHAARIPLAELQLRVRSTPRAPLVCSLRQRRRNRRTAQKIKAVAQRPTPPQPPDAWLPFGELPGADAIFTAVSSPQFELGVAVVVLLSVGGYALDTLPSGSLPPRAGEMLSRFELATSIGFALEYMLRWASRSLRPSYLLKPLMIVDLVSFLPSLLAILQLADAQRAHALAFLRVLRILKLQRYVRDETSFASLKLALGLDGDTADASVGVLSDRTALPLARVVLTLVSLLLVSAGFLYEAESAQIPDYFSALYFALTTLTTIGTIQPQTPAGTLVVSGSVLAGLAVVPFQLSALAEAFATAPARASRDVDELEDEPFAGSESQPQFAAFTDRVRTCKACRACAHRPDASYCYACGAMLPELRPDAPESTYGEDGDL